MGVPHTVEVGLGGSYRGQALTASTHYKFWPMRTTNSDLSVTQVASVLTPPAGWSSGDSLTVFGTPLLRQPSVFPEGGLAIRLNGTSQYLASVYNETSEPTDIGAHTMAVVLEVHALPGVGDEPAVMGGSTDFALTLKPDGRVYGYYNGASVVDLPIALNTPTQIMLTRAGTSPTDTVTLYVNDAVDSATPSHGSIARGHVHLGKHWSNADFLSATYSWAGFHAAALTQATVLAHFAALTWTDLAAWFDVGNEPLIIERGIRDDSPLSRVAATGTCEFALNNAFTNFAGLTGRYSPAHANALPGFGIGTPVRVTIYDTSVFIGRIATIGATPGRRADGLTRVMATDLMDDLARTSITDIPVLLNVRSDEVMQVIADRLPNQPHGLVLHQGSDVYSVALDNARGGLKAKALEETVSLQHSEFGFTYVSREGQLVHENRDTRALAPLALTLDEFMVDDLEPADETRDRINYVSGTSHPRVFDADPVRVLFSLATAQALAVGETKTILGPYRVDDLPDLSSKIGAVNMISPAPGTDYAMNDADDGSGADLTASLQVIASYGASGVRYTLTNTGVTNGFVTLLQARGTGVYDFRTVESIRDDAVAIAEHGVNPLEIDMRYLEDTDAAQDIIERAFAQAQATVGRHKRVLLTAFDDDSELPDDLLTHDISTRIELVPETMTGIGGQYHIDGTRIELLPGHLPTVEWWLRPAEEVVT